MRTVSRGLPRQSYWKCQGKVCTSSGAGGLHLDHTELSCFKNIHDLGSSMNIQAPTPSPRRGESKALLCPVTELEGKVGPVWERQGAESTASLLSFAWRHSNPHLLPHPAELPPYTTVGLVIYCPPHGKCFLSYWALQTAERRQPVPEPQQILGCSKIRRGKHRDSKLVHEKKKQMLNITFGD